MTNQDYLSYYGGVKMYLYHLSNYDQTGQCWVTWVTIVMLWSSVPWTTKEVTIDGDVMITYEE